MAAFGRSRCLQPGTTRADVNITRAWTLPAGLTWATRQSQNPAYCAGCWGGLGAEKPTATLCGQKKFPALFQSVAGRQLPGTAIQNKPGTCNNSGTGANPRQPSLDNGPHTQLQIVPAPENRPVWAVPTLAAKVKVYLRTRCKASTHGAEHGQAPASN